MEPVAIISLIVFAAAVGYLVYRARKSKGSGTGGGGGNDRNPPRRH